MESSTAQFLWRQFACVQLPKGSGFLPLFRAGGLQRSPLRFSARPGLSWPARPAEALAMGYFFDSI